MPDWMLGVWILAALWFIGNPVCWWLTFRRLGGAFNWRVFLGPFAYVRWWHEGNERW